MSLKKIMIIFAILLISASALWAGDVASFVDLGFSPDGRIYMFGQHGVLSPSLRPWADLFIVDVAANNFVPNGRISHTQDIPIKAGQDGSGVFFQLVSRNSSLANSHGINYQNQAQPLYISRAENPPTRGETIDFRDFRSGNSYKAEIVPTIEGSGQNLRSSFFIRLESRSSNGQLRTYVVGTPQLRRSRITAYNFNRVLIDSHGESLIFVIEMKRVAENGFDIRYMVEALRL